MTAFTAVPREGYDEPRSGSIVDEGPLATATAAMYPNIDHVLIRSGHHSPIDDIDRNFHLFDRPTPQPVQLAMARGNQRGRAGSKPGDLLTGRWAI